MRKLPFVWRAGLFAAALLSVLPTGAHAAAMLELLPHHAPVARTGTVLSHIDYQSPSFDAHRANTMYALINGLDAYGTAGTPAYFDRIEGRTTFTIYETTATPFNSWLGDSSPEGAYAGEYGTLIREGLRVESDTPFRLGDIAYRYQDDLGSDFTLNLAQLGLRFSNRAVGRLTDGTLIEVSLGSGAADAAVDLIGFYYYGLAFINVAGSYTLADWAASGQRPDDYWDEINQLYVGNPYSFSDTWTLTQNGQVLARDVFAGDIVEAPEPAMFGLLGLGVAGLAFARRPRASISLAGERKTRA